MPVNKRNLQTEAIPRDMKRIKAYTGNIYKSIAVIGQRAREVAKEEREELHEKLEEFAPASDNLEEVFENKEQIEISQYYERMPKPTIVATEEFLHGEVKFTELDKKSKKELAEEGLTTPSRSESVSSAQNN
jgi:DNA-directed RNA polymerase subunit K/omega